MYIFLYYWFLWSAIEVAPGVYEWEDYDRQFDLAAQNGMKTIIAEMITAAPEWAYRRFAHVRLETRAGDRIDSRIGGSSATGGLPGLCLDNDDYRTLAERFLRAIAMRYEGHPSLGGYDIWNECNCEAEVCYCLAKQAKFRDWLRTKYGDLRTLGQAWQGHSFAEGAEVSAPRQPGAYPDTLDWLQFRLDNAYSSMRWWAQLIRSVDPDCAITAYDQSPEPRRARRHDRAERDRRLHAVAQSDRPSRPTVCLLRYAGCVARHYDHLAFPGRCRDCQAPALRHLR